MKASITLANKKKIKTCSNFLHTLDRNDVLNTRLPSDFPLLKQFSPDFMLKFLKIANFRGPTFYYTGQKISLYQKHFEISTYSGVETCS